MRILNPKSEIQNPKCSLGDYSVGVPPLPIPNREVKPDSADGTALLWESRSSPTLIKSLMRNHGAFFIGYYYESDHGHAMAWPYIQDMYL